MFDKLMSKTPSNNEGFIWSLEGDHYLAYAKSPQGEIVNKCDQAFKSLYQAQEWLRHEGVCSISLSQSSAYFEMIGQDKDVH